MSSHSSKPSQDVTRVKSYRYRTENERPDGKLKFVVVGGGKEYRSRSFTETCKQLDIVIIYWPEPVSVYKGSELVLHRMVLDVLVVGNDGEPVGMPWLWSATIGASREIVAKELQLEAPSGEAAARFIRKVSELIGANSGARPARARGERKASFVRHISARVGHGEN